MDDFAKLLAAHASGPKANKRERDDDRGGRGQNQAAKRRRPHDNRRREEEEEEEKERKRRPWRHAWSSQRLDQVKGKYLVIVPAGDKSLHNDEKFPWHELASKGAYDLCVVYYGSCEEIGKTYKSHSRYYFERKGPKWQLVRHALNQLSWKEYEYIWLPDDDLEMDPKLIVQMFSIASKHGVLLGQPALFDHNIQPQYKDILLRRQDLLLHYCNFVEIMAPFLRVDVLQHVFHTFDTDECKSGWGLDMLWATMLDFNDIAVIDATPLLHTRPQNAFTVDNSFYKAYKIDPQRECYDLMQRFRFRDYRKRRFQRQIELPSDWSKEKEDDAISRAEEKSRPKQGIETK